MFVLSKAAFALVRPSSLLIIFAVAGFILGRAPRKWVWGRKLSPGLLALGIGGLASALILPIDSWVIRPLEGRFPRPAMPDQVAGIVLLGGGVDEFLSANRGLPTLTRAGERITAFVALARRYPQARLVFTGGSGALFAEGSSEADPTRMLLDSLGVPPDRVIYEGDSRNTWENAVFTKRLVDPKPGETWLLVTSASHMPRAVGIFRETGWTVLAYPVGYRSMTSGRPAESSAADRLTTLDWAVHEWIGLVSYRIMRRTDALFPAP